MIVAKPINVQNKSVGEVGVGAVVVINDSTGGQRGARPLSQMPSNNPLAHWNSIALRGTSSAMGVRLGARNSGWISARLA